MTQPQAEKIANALIGVAAAAAAYYVLRDRALRRQLFTIAKRAAIASAPWLIGEARRAWLSTAPRSDRSSGRDMMTG